MSLMNEYRGQRDSLRVRRKAVAAEVESHRQTLLSELSLTRKAEDLSGEFIASLGVQLHERLMELAGIDRQIKILSAELEG